MTTETATAPSTAVQGAGGGWRRRAAGLGAALVIGSGIILAGQSPAAAVNDATYKLTLYVVGDPSTPVSPAILGDLSILGTAPADRMVNYQASPAGVNTMPFPTVTVNCSGGGTATPTGALSDGFGQLPVVQRAIAVDYTLTCTGGETVSSYTVAIPITGSSCLVASGGGVGITTGTYNATSTQRNLVSGSGANGTNLPTGILAPNPPLAPDPDDAPWNQWVSIHGFASAFPAYVATNGGVAAAFDPETLYNTELTGGGTKYVAMGVYMPAVRACAPPTPSPGSAVSVGGGIAPGVGGGPISNGGAQYFTGTDTNGVTGLVRALALPLNSGVGPGSSPWGGFRTSGYSRCSAANGFSTECVLTGIPVHFGGSGTPKKWTTSGCGGQFVDLRIRASTWLGLSQYSPAAQTAGLTGCS